MNESKIVEPEFDDEDRSARFWRRRPDGFGRKVVTRPDGFTVKEHDGITVKEVSRKEVGRP